MYRLVTWMQLRYFGRDANRRNILCMELGAVRPHGIAGARQMAAKRLVDELGYRDSPNYLQGDALERASGFSHIFRRAKASCQLRGVYALNQRAHGTGNMLVPLVYVCEIQDSSIGTSIHKNVWNQNTVPFVIVESPSEVRVYSGFEYERPPGDSEPRGVLRPAVAFDQVARDLASFRAEAIDGGTVWREWEPKIDPRTRVDWSLLAKLERLGSWLRGTHLPKSAAHALIGRYVYLRYLWDREILSLNKFRDWSVDPSTVFGRSATLQGFRAVNRRLDDWLNGSVFPVPERGPGAPTVEHLRRVAGTFRGDDPISGQLHLDFSAYDFSHIPIETLSVIYEQFLHAEGLGHEAGAYYTPVPLVDFILQELEDRRPLARGMRVLDPACGSGAFLVQCYRRLIERELAKSPENKLRPGELRQLLVEHIFGVDRDEDACRVAEMSLILTLLDYIAPPDLSRHPTFKIPPLLGKNVFQCNLFDDPSPIRRGEDREQFQWVVGNPPWIELTPATCSNDDEKLLNWMKRNSEMRPTGGNQAAEAFAWEVTDYLAADGCGALLLPAMTLFKYESKQFREKYFARVGVWCVANFANLAEVLFAPRSRVPAAAFFFTAPPAEAKPEKILTFCPMVANQEANRPIDSGRRVPTWNIVVNASEVAMIPTRDAVTGDQLVWKIAMWGSQRDARLVTSLRKRFPALKDFAKSRRIAIHEGFQLRTKGTAGTEFVPTLVGKKILVMDRLRRLKSIYAFPDDAFETITDKQSYARKGRWKLPMIVSAPPHILVDATRKFAVYSDRFIAVPARQIGIAGPKRERNLLKALSIFLSSDFAVYYQFLMSPQWGVKREVATLQALKHIPTPLGELSNRDLGRWVELSAEFVAAFRQPTLFEKGGGRVASLERTLNKFVYDALGLEPTERWIVDDLVNVRMALDEGKLGKSATSLPSEEDFRLYGRALKSELDSFLRSDSTHHQVDITYDDVSGMVQVSLGKDMSGAVRAMKADAETASAFADVRQLLRRRRSQWIYFDRNLLQFEGSQTWLFKPLQKMHWTRSQALVDADQIIAEMLAPVRK